MEDIIYDKSLLRQPKQKLSSSSSPPSITKRSNSSSLEEDDDNSSEGKINGRRFSFAIISSLFRKKATSSPSSNDDNAYGEDGTAPAILSSGSNASNSNCSELHISKHIEISKTGLTTRVTTSSPVIDLTKPGQNSKGIARVEKEVPSPRRRTASKKEIEELDSVVANINMNSITSYDEEESMMGYSLASGHEAEKKNKKNTKNDSISVYNTNTNQHNTIRGKSINMTRESENAEQYGDDASHVSSNESEPSHKNPFFAGVQNLLYNSHESKRPNQTKKWYGQFGFGKKNQPQGFISSDSESNSSVADTLEQFLDGAESIPDEALSLYIEDDVDDGEQEVVILNAPTPQNVPPHSDEEGADSSYKELDSVNGYESSVMSGYSSARFSDADPIYNIPAGTGALGYIQSGDGGRGLPDFGQLPQITPVPSEEMDEMVMKTPVMTNYIRSSATPDDTASNAPSDERHSGVPEGQTGSPVSFLNIPVIDNTDPAVVEYLMKERLNAKLRTRRKRENRKQSPVTMEV
jgi:hypothetical protein